MPQTPSTRKQLNTESISIFRIVSLTFWKLSGRMRAAGFEGGALMRSAAAPSYESASSIFKSAAITDGVSVLSSQMEYSRRLFAVK